MTRGGERPRRHFTLADAMVLVAATAAGIAAGTPGESGDWRWAGVSVPLAWALAVVGISLGRPGDRRAFRRGAPGLHACLAVTVGAAAIILSEASYGVLNSWSAPWIQGPWIHYSFRMTAEYAGGSVAVAWLALVATRRWRPVPTWPDRLGRLIGAYWLLLLVVSQPAQHLIIP